MEFKGTPGPWKVLTLGPHWNNDSLEHVQVTYGYYGECICDTVYDINDANLIAAAPDLLDALLEMQRNGRKQGWNDNYESSMKKTMMAINKALGVNE